MYRTEMVLVRVSIRATQGYPSCTLKKPLTWYRTVVSGGVRVATRYGTLL